MEGDIIWHTEDGFVKSGPESRRANGFSAVFREQTS
jgi:hypothetical protein